MGEALTPFFFLRPHGDGFAGERPSSQSAARDRVGDEVAEGATGGGIETKMGVLAVALDEAAPLERPPEPLLDPFHQGLKLLTGEGGDTAKYRRAVPVRNEPSRHSMCKTLFRLSAEPKRRIRSIARSTANG